MRRRQSALVLIAFVLPLVLSGVTTGVEAQTSPSFLLATSVAPLSGIVSEVGGAYVETSILLSEGVEPHAFTVTPQVIAIAESADLLVFTGHFDWEEELANQTATPYITLHDAGALENYEDYGAELSPFPGGEEHTTAQEHDHDGNPHAWWLLPSNAAAIANTTRAALTTLNAALSDVWDTNFGHFLAELEDLHDLILEADDEYHFSSMSAVVVFPAEAYVAEAFGIEVEAVLINEGQTISGDELIDVQNAFRNGSISLILGSDVARLQTAGEFAYQLVDDYGGTLVWWRAVFFSGLSDYTAIMTHNLGALTTALEGGPGSQSAAILNAGLIGLSVILGVLALGEAAVIVRRLRE